MKFAQLGESESLGVVVGGASGSEGDVTSVALEFFKPFSNSVLAEPKLRANFGMAEPPKTRTTNMTTTMIPSTPSSAASNTVHSFVVYSLQSSPHTLRENPATNIYNAPMPHVSRRTLRDALSVALTVGAYGVAFGAAGVAAGFTVLQTSLFSLLTFTGASQFAAVGVVASGGAGISAVVAAALLSTRNALYSLQMAPQLEVRGWRRLIAAQLTIDESTNVALAQAPQGLDAVRHGFWLTGSGVFLFWNIFTLVGALGAKSLGNPAAWGLDAAVPAAFLGLLWPRLHDARVRIVAAVVAVFSLVIAPLLPSGTPIIATVLVAVVAGWR